MYKITIDVDSELPGDKWPTLPRKLADEELTQAQYREILERGEVPGQKYYKIALSHPEDRIAFKAKHKRYLGTKLIANDGQFYSIVPHQGGAGHMNLYIVYWLWERKNRPKPPTAVQVLSSMPGPSGAGLGAIWASSERRHVIAVVASKANTLIRSGWPVIKQWNGPMTLQQLGCFVCEWYAAGSPGAKGKGPGKVDVATMPDLLGFV